MITASRNIVFVFILIALSIRDMKEQIIPNSGIILGLFVWLLNPAVYTVLSVIYPVQDRQILETLCKMCIFRIAEGIVISSAVLAVICLMNHMLKKKTMGMGDIKLIFVASLYLGFWNTVYMMFAAFAAGLAYAFCLEWAGPDGKMRDAFPLGPFISLPAGILVLADLSHHFAPGL